MKKKLFRAVLSMAAALLIAVSALPRTAYAAGASLSGSSSVQPGNSVTLTLSVDSKIYGLTADLNCGEGLTFTNYSCSVSGWSILVNQNRFSVYGTNSASGGVITVTLKVSSSVQGGLLFNRYDSDGDSYNGNRFTPNLQNVDYRHNKQINCALVDGHVESMGVSWGMPDSYLAWTDEQ